MKKTVWIVVGIVVIAVLVLIGRDKANKRTTEDTESKMVSQASSLPGKSGQGSRQDVGVTGQGLQVITSVASNLGGTEKQPAPQLSDAVRALLLQDGKEYNYSSLQAAINELEYDLSVGDVAALMEMLKFPNDCFPEGMRPIEINAVKNDVLDKLLRQEQLPEGLGLQMVEMAADPNQDVVWRDYCVQFMGPFYERASLAKKNTNNHENENSVDSVSSSEAGGENKPDELKIIHDAMFQALDERTSTIAGTSLIGLELLSRTHEEFDRVAIVDSALDIASDESASATSRMTALRLSAFGNLNPEVVQTARSLAQAGETVLMRSAAIVTLGEIGASADRELLESYLHDEDRQIAQAAKWALERMDAPREAIIDRSRPPAVIEKTAGSQAAEKRAPVLIN